MTTIAKLIDQSVFLILSNIATKVFNFLGFIILTHTLTSESIGLIGIALGYMVLANYFAVTPETALLKEKLTNQNKKISSYIIFWALKSILLVIVGIGISIYLYFQYGMIMAIFFAVFSLVNISNILGDMFSFLFFIREKQKKVFTINLIFSVLLLIGIILLKFSPSLVVYGIILLIISILKDAYLIIDYQRNHQYKFKVKGTKSYLLENIKEFSIWHHLNGITIKTIFYIDTIILSFFTSLTIIGDYTVALKISFVAFEISLLLEKIMSTTFKKLSLDESGKYAKAFIKIFSIVTLVELIGFIGIGYWFIKYVFNVNDLFFTYTITAIILTGIFIVNTVWPLVSLLITKFSIKELFTHITLPTALISIPCYIILTAMFGAYGTAFGNIINYSIYAILLLFYTLPKIKLKSSKEIERKLFQQTILKCKNFLKPL